jgi:hypothetical protein
MCQISMLHGFPVSGMHEDLPSVLLKTGRRGSADSLQEVFNRRFARTRVAV